MSRRVSSKFDWGIKKCVFKFVTEGQKNEEKIIKTEIKENLCYTK